MSLVTAGEEEIAVGVDRVSSGDEMVLTVKPSPLPTRDPAVGILVLLKFTFSPEDGSEAAFHQLSRDIVDFGKTVVLPADDNSVESAVLTVAGTGGRGVNDRPGSELTAAVAARLFASATLGGNLVL